MERPAAKLGCHVHVLVPDTPEEREILGLATLVITGEDVPFEQLRSAEHLWCALDEAELRSIIGILTRALPDVREAE